MAAFADNGSGGVTKLWEYSFPSVPVPPEKYQYKYGIWDIDADGMNEVIGPFAASDGFIHLRRRPAGLVRASLALPPVLNPAGPLAG